MSNRSFEELQRVLGHYHFKDPALLRIAMTHSSFANESKVPPSTTNAWNFGRQRAVGRWWRIIFSTTAPARKRADPHARLACVGEALFAFAKTIDLGRYLRLGHGEELSGGRTRPSVVSDAFER